MKHLLLAALLSAGALAAQPMAGTGSVEGQVVNALTREPIRKATVVLLAPEIRLTDDTDAAGKFHFTGLLPGTYRLTASRAGFLDHGARHPIVLASDDHVTESEISLPPQGLITGQILDADDDPSPGAPVDILQQVYRDGGRQWVQIDRAIANDIGEYRFAKLAPGRYVIRARNPKALPNNRYDNKPSALRVPFAVTYYPNGPNRQAAVPVEIGAGTEVHGMDIHLVPGVPGPRLHVSGKLVGVPPGAPVLSVSLDSEQEDSCGGDSSSAGAPDYVFDLTTCPGQYTIHASVYSGGPEAYGSEAVTVAGNVTGIVVAMASPPAVTGKIRLAESGAQVKLQGVKATLSDRTDVHFNVREALSDAAGKLAFGNPVQPGHYAVYVDARTIPDGCFLKEVTLGGREVHPDDFEILVPARLELVLSNTAGKITGSVVDGDNKLFATSAVTLISTDGKSRPMKIPPDDSGNFQFTSLPPGKYNLFAWEEVDANLWQDPEYLRKYESRATEVTVGSNESKNVQLRVILAEEMR